MWQGEPGAEVLDPAAWGVQASYTDVNSLRVDSPAATVAALTLALARGGAEPRVPPTSAEALAAATASPSLTCHPPPGPRAWGWAVQLPATRSRSSWGIGDLADLRRLGAWARGQGAGMLLVSPLHAPLPRLPQQPSPYYPGSRRFLNPLLLAIDEVPGAEAIGATLGPLRDQAVALNHVRVIDRDRIFDLKMEALTHAWSWWLKDQSNAVERREFAAFRDAGGETLARYAAFCSLSEQLRGTWPQWPQQYRRPDAGGVVGLVKSGSERVAFHQWLQWLATRQLNQAAAEIDLVQDLAVGADPAGADTWEWQDLRLPGFHVGAPPDEFNAAGQDWGFPAFDPWRLLDRGLGPNLDTISAAMRHGGGMRLDHVMGLFRLWLIPDGTGPEEGAYLHYPSAALLEGLAERSRAHRSWVVGEDLGVVGPGVRDTLRTRGMLSYRLLWFDEGDPAAFPEMSMAAVTTHDLPTIAGAWTGADLERRRAAGLLVNEQAELDLVTRLERVTGARHGGPLPDVVRGAHASLARASSRVVVATLEDCLLVEDRPNMPGTSGGWDNWSTALPRSLEDFADDGLVSDVAAILGAGRERGEE
ncbi:MAG: 4-alpha-glucanotransferase [Candidatus Dormibacteria bacterium]